MTSTTEQTAWPEGVIGRFKNLGGAPVDVIDEQRSAGRYSITHVFSARCTGALCDGETGGHGGTTYTVPTEDAEWAEECEAVTQRLAKWAQGHAERCRAMPRP